MRQRNERRFETGLVTCRHIHVTHLCVRGSYASPCTYGNKRAVAALLPRTQSLKLLERALAPRVAPVVDVARRQRLLTREARARVERSIRADGVRVLLVHVAGPVVDPVVRRKPVPLGFLAQERL